MPVVKLGGRLGNQLFQVAFGIAQAQRSGIPLLFDSSGLDDPQRKALESWVGELSQASPRDVGNVLGQGIWAKPYRATQRFLPHHRRKWILQSESRYRAENLGPKTQAYFDGYWQSYRYFESEAKAVRSRVYFRRSLAEEVPGAILRLAPLSGTVGVHVRRGDYVGSVDFPVTSPEYYRMGLERISTLQPIDHVLVFSDDPSWCRQYLKLGVPTTFVEGNTPETDLAALSSCGAFVIGPSTFGWWGAWLSRSRIVCVPDRWFPSYGRTPPLTDIYPPHWIIIPSMAEV
jgi:hypothetical protein